MRVRTGAGFEELKDLYNTTMKTAKSGSPRTAVPRARVEQAGAEEVAVYDELRASFVQNRHVKEITISALGSAAGSAIEELGTFEATQSQMGSAVFGFGTRAHTIEEAQHYAEVSMNLFLTALAAIEPGDPEVVFPAQ